MILEEGFSSILPVQAAQNAFLAKSLSFSSKSKKLLRILASMT